MKTFHYKGYDASGHARRGVVEAESLKAARELLAAGGVLAEKLSASHRAAAFGVEMRATVYRELAALLHAGVPLVSALEILIDSPELTETRILIGAVRDRIKEGGSLATAMGAVAREVSDFETAILETAEQTAAMGAMLDRLADFLEERQALRERLHSALIYPAIVFGLGIFVAGAMLGVLLPRTQVFLEQSQAQLPWLTRAVLWVGHAALSWGLVLGILVVALAAAARLRMLRDSELRERWDRLMYVLPGWGRGYRILVSLRFARTMGVLLRAGVLVVEAMRMAGRATGSCMLRKLVDREADAVKHGDRLSAAVGRIPPLAGSLPGWLRIGEESGNVAEMVERFGVRYQARWEQFIMRGLSLLEPLLIVVIGGFVLIIVLAVLLPILTLTQSVGM